MNDDDYTPQEMVDWLRQPQDVRVCLSHGINMCRVNTSPREMFAANQIEMLMERVVELEAALLPFAAIADDSTANLADNYMYPYCYPMSAFRAAKAALEKSNV
jgi:hypothetical protein